MSAIIKSSNVTDLAVRPIAVPPPVPQISQAEEERERLQRKIADLERELRQRDAAIAELRLEVERALERGTAEGRTIGLAEAEDRQSERLALLKKGVEQAQSALSENLASLERLSAVLARECVDIILGDAEDRAEFLSSIVSAQIAKLDQAMILAVEVSDQDFPDEEALAALAERTGVASRMFSLRADMAPGGCVMTLRLGRMEIGLNQQWSTLRELLGEMALPEKDAK